MLSLPKVHSYLDYINEKRQTLAMKFGLFGIALLFFSLLVSELLRMVITEPTGIWSASNFVLNFIGKIGEVFIFSGFIAFVLEQHTISSVVKDGTKSVIDEIINSYFRREELIAFMLNCIKNLNKYESIDDEVYRLYEKHGLLELTNEPQRFNHKLVFRKEGEVENEKDKIQLSVIHEYRATNAALKSENEKRINGDGLVSYFDRVVDISVNNDNEILKYIEKNFNMCFKYLTSFELKGTNSHKEDSFLTPVYIPLSDFDVKNCRPKTFDKNIQFKPELYGAYELLGQSNNKKTLKLSYFLNVKIPAEKHMDLYFKLKTIASDYDLWTYEFISYTEGVDCELLFDEEFETKIEDVLIGVPIPTTKSDIKFKYNGWIMPHSSISVSWRRLDKQKASL